VGREEAAVGEPVHGPSSLVPPNAGHQERVPIDHLKEQRMHGEDLTTYFTAFHYPAGKGELRLQAAHNGAPKDLLELIDQLPDDTSVRSYGQIMEVLGLEDQRGEGAIKQ